ncbi:MAG: hydrogenase nickel incorporation protein HypB [Desulfohalobiaceae bacterium]|nr:hydrogenase nickel incorporation protein HypB [Desulfohalobiaceae bacterium]
MGRVNLIQVKEGILEENTRQAGAIRDRLRRRGTFLLNLMSSPGAGKTSLILETVRALAGSWRMGVIEADIDSSLDAERVAEAGVRATQLGTGGLCHLDASMVAQGLSALGEEDLDLIILENVGNLVCPAEFDTGAHTSAMILSLPEGEDKPRKYPLMFSTSQALVINKTDYMALEEFDIEAVRESVRKLNPDMGVFPLSCRSGEGLADWTGWLERCLREQNRAGSAE